MEVRNASFSWYELRTTDLSAARSFYAEVVGLQAERSGEASVFYSGEHPVGGLVNLPERARAKGAPPHWLGHVAVHDVDASARRFVAFGGQILTTVQAADGNRVIVLRDPQGAVLALSSQRSVRSRGAVAWHELHATDREQAWRTYATLFGWKATEILHPGPEVGPYQMFSWDGAEHSVGGMASTARAPHIHTHWLFYFTVEDVDDALASVRSLGGVVVNGPRQAPGGARVALCDDPQGAAFALHQHARKP